MRESGYAGFRRRGIPLVHQVAVAGPFPAAGRAAPIAAGQLARDPDIATLATTWACSAGTARLSGCTDDDLTIWLSKDLVS